MSLLIKLFGSDNAMDRLREVVVENQVELARIDGYRGQTYADKRELNRLLEEFESNASDEAAQRALELARTIESEKAVRDQLTQRGTRTIKEIRGERTKDALRDVLKNAQKRLSAELNASRKRDELYAGESLALIPGALIDIGAKTAPQLAADTISPATRALQASLSQAESYLARLDAMTFDQLAGPIRFCLDDK